MKEKVFLFLFFLSCSIISFGQNKPYIVERPITWNTDRERLSLEYMLKRHGIHADTALIEPKIVVVHFTENMSVNGTVKTFNPIYLPGRRDLQAASNLNVSAQFVVGRDGTIYQLMPDNFFARHTIGLNYCAIGIENIGTSKNPLTKAQLNANAQLIAYLKTKYPIEYVIGHHEYQAFNKTLWWKETNPTYITRKRDPGNAFMVSLREKLGMSKKLKVIPIPSG